MKSENWIYAYYQQIRNGTVTVGKWIRLAYEYLVKGIEHKQFFYDSKKANRVIDFIEAFAHHHEGALAPQLIKLELWQKAALASIFGVVDKDGNRQFREVLLVMGRKNGKTLLAASIALYMLYMDGEYGPRIYFAAPKLQQASLCYDAMFQMIKQEPELETLVKKRRMDIYLESNNGSAMPLAFSAKKSDGLNISCGIGDESASWDGQGGLRFYEVLKSSMGSRKSPLLLNITTSGYVNDGIYDELIKRSTRFLLGDSKERRMLPLLYMIDDVTKWNDINELSKANPNLGTSIGVDYLLEEVAVAEGSYSRKVEFMTKYCCVKQNQSNAWLSSQTVENMFSNKPLQLEDFKDTYCVGGLDLSQTTDLTAAVVVIERDKKLHVFAHFWLPSERIEEATERDNVPYGAYIKRGFLSPSGENFVDYHDCFNWFKDLVEKYSIYPLQVGYDRYSAQYLVQDMQSYGFHMDDVYQGDNLWGVLQEMEGLAKDGTFECGDNDLLKMHLLNSAIKMNVQRGRGRLVKISPRDHIDGMAALADAVTVRTKWFNSIGQKLANDRKR